MNAMEIETGIPIPPHGNAGKTIVRSGLLFPFDGMRIGDSFLAPAGVTRALVAEAATRHGKRSRRGYTTRVMPDGRARCWRVA